MLGPSPQVFDSVRVLRFSLECTEPRSYHTSGVGANAIALGGEYVPPPLSLST
jgi:hypothetical protein